MTQPRKLGGSGDPQDPEFVEAYESVLRNLPRRAGLSPQDREDVVQDSCVRVLTARRAQAVHNPFRYLMRAARNLMIDRHRARQRLGDLFSANEDSQAQPTDTLDPERILSGQERLAVIRDALDQLPPRCAEALRLHRFAGLSYPAIARQMQISCSMVEKHIAEAMLRLGRALDEAEGVAAACANIERP